MKVSIFSKNNVFLSALIVFSLAAAANAAQTGQSLRFSGNSLTWEDCVNIARQNNPQYKIAQAALQTAKSNYNLAVNQYTPSANIQYGYQKSNYNLLTEGGDTWLINITASQNIFNWQAISNIRIQKENLILAQADLRQTSATVRYNLRQAYLAMLYAQENIDVYKSIYDIRKKSADMIRLQYEGGNESKGNTIAKAPSPFSVITWRFG